MKRLLVAVPTLALLLSIVALTSCTALARHSAPPYDRDPAAAARLERMAAQWCRDAGQPGGAPALPFRFDGCSWWPDRFDDADWRDCCQQHDYAYWCGGSESDRERADRELGRCVAREANAPFAALMGAGVRAGGHPAVPMYFRWGFGHAYTGCYPETQAGAPSAP